MADVIHRLKSQLDALDANPYSDLRSKIDTLNELARELRYIDSAQSAAYSRRAYDLSCSAFFAPEGYGKGIASSLLMLTVHNYFPGHYHEALTQLFEVQRLAERIGDSSILADVLLNFAHTYTILGDLSVALDYALKAVGECHEAGLQLQEADAYNKLGIVHGKAGSLQPSLDALLMSLALYRRIENRAGEAVLLNDIAVTQKTLLNFESALASAHQSLLIAQQLSMNSLEANSLCTIGEIYLAYGDTDRALEFFQKSIAFSRQLNFKYVEMVALLSSGQLHLQSGHLGQALPCLLEALDIAQQIDTKPELSQCYQFLAETYKRQGDFGAALAYHEQFHAVYQAVFNDESDQRIKYLQIAHDTETAQKEAEIFRLKNVELEQEITQRKQSERERLESALEEKRIQILANFITQASHEFRTPLSVIGTNAYLLKRIADPEKQKQRVQVIEEQVGHIAELVNNMVVLSKLDSGNRELGIEEVELNEILRDSYQAFTSLHRETHPQIRLDLSEDLIHLPGSSVFLRQAIDYILENSFRYTPEDGVITLQTDRVENHALIKVTDTGVGISDDALPHIFERFYRVDVAGTTRGFGLGLSIAKAIIDRHQGRIEVDSRLGQGSIFRIWLPTD